mmetsp:Transcript_11703/g.22434  ORF Transcript_11703/g.22434 Transcript_11703/m.22434 type:complete len:91 (-) Transcript_11703:2502-2774(-)
MYGLGSAESRINYFLLDRKYLTIIFEVSVNRGRIKVLRKLSVGLCIACFTACLLGSFAAVISNPLEFLATCVFEIAYFFDQLRYFGLEIF